jgi:hypothetical protein
VLFPIYVALLIWGGLLLRDARLRAPLPLRRRARVAPALAARRAA